MLSSLTDLPLALNPSSAVVRGAHELHLQGNALAKPDNLS